jgi:hypothetical protein
MRSSRYIFVEPYYGAVYQLCTDEEMVSLIVWEQEKEGEK